MKRSQLHAAVTYQISFLIGSTTSTKTQYLQTTKAATRVFILRMMAQQKRGRCSLQVRRKSPELQLSAVLDDDLVVRPVAPTGRLRLNLLDDVEALNNLYMSRHKSQSFSSDKAKETTG